LEECLFKQTFCQEIRAPNNFRESTCKIRLQEKSNVPISPESSNISSSTSSFHKILDDSAEKLRIMVSSISISFIFFATCNTEKQRSAMSDTDLGLKSLEEYVRKWAGYNDDRTEKWLTELQQNDIDDIKVLDIVANSPDWEEFLNGITIPLRTYLRNEFEKATRSKF
jgi:hypothetical protein